MKRRLFIVLAVAGTVLLASSLACCFSVPDIRIPRFWESWTLRVVRGSGEVVEETRDVSDFTGVALSSLGNISIELGDEEALRIEAEDNLMPLLEIEVVGQMLEIKTESGVNFIPTEPIDFYLTVKELDTIEISGLGNVDVPDLEVRRFSIHISGGGDVDIESLTADTLDVEISGLGDVSIAGGEVEQQGITISGGGNYKATSMESAEADIHISGLGSAFVRVNDHLEVTISGGGSVEYLGNPTVDENISGLGDVKRFDD